MKLRNYQQETLDILHRMEAKHDCFSTVVNLPTGAGKTNIALQFCEDVIKKGKGKVLWLADRRELLIQSRKRIEDSSIKCQFLFDKAKSDVKPQKEERFSQKADVVFATIGSMVKIYGECDASFSKWIGDDNKLYIIYDEAHHIGESQAFNLLTSLVAKRADSNDVKQLYKIKRFSIIGLTATVYRGDRFNDAFKAFFKDGYCKENGTFYHSDSDYGEYCDVDIQSIDEIRVSVVDINELIEGYRGEKSVLVEPQMIKVDEFMGGMPPRAAQSKNKEEYLKNTNAMKYLAERIKKHKLEWGKLAVIVSTISEAKILCEFLGKDAILYTSAEERTREGTEKKRVIDIFKEDSTGKNILVTVHKFDEGVDVPDLDTLYLFAKTNSQIMLRQRVGRVIRKNEKKPDKVATVIWQAYPEEEKYLSKAEFEKLLKEPYEYKVQTIAEMENDYQVWLKNNKLQLPIIMYRKPLRVDFINSYFEWMLFRAEEVFGTDILSQAKSVGFFYNSDEYEASEDVIFVRNIEYEGYLQFQRLLQNDWLSVLRDKECSSFAEYATVLGAEEDDLLQDIKEVCFYQSNATYSDSLGQRKVKRIFVRDADIKTFFKWFMSGKLSYSNLSVRSKEDKQQIADKELFEYITDKKYVTRSFDCKTEDIKLRELRKQLGEGLKPDKESNAEKEYTELLLYGVEKDHRDNYQEMIAKRLMMRAGVTDQFPRAILEEDKGEDALCGQHFIKRRVKDAIEKGDWILYASALVDVPNHICVTQKDVNEYERMVKSSIWTKNHRDGADQVVKECLLALGYAKNDEIIKYQCSKMNELPKLLQYVIYQKCYHKLIESVRFIANGTLHPKCTVQKQLVSEYENILKEFDVNPSQMSVDPVNDVIYDCRPYLKSVYHYQGIKPEFLCRMANDLIELSKSEPKHVIDGFGGSGTYTMNSYWRKLHLKKYYNDLGIMNTAFYKCVQTPGLLEELKHQIQDIIDDAFRIHCDDYIIQYLYTRYNGFLNDYGAGKNSKSEEEGNIPPMLYWGKNIVACEAKYRHLYHANVREYKKNHSGEISYRMVELEDRLYFGRKSLQTDDSASRYVERYFHVFMIQLNTVYLAMTNIFKRDELQKKYDITDVDLAVLFFFYNTLSHRHFYNDCTLKLIQNMMCNYKKWLDYGAECFKNVEVLQKDALKLLNDKIYNTQDTVWYLDIPYAETSSADYVAQWFDMEEFIKGLSQLQGNYIVSSRCNICLPNERKKELAEADSVGAYKAAENNSKKDISDVEILDSLPLKYVKEFNVFSFFSSFISESDEELYKFIESLKIERREVKKDSDGEGRCKKQKETPFKGNHIAKNKAAKYILIPYTKMQEEYYEEAGKVKKRFVENSSVISEDYVRRMLTATHFSNIPVDIMVTDIDIDKNRMPVQPAFDASGKVSASISVLPTFKTGIDSTPYMTEPLVIIMEYGKFMEVLLSLLYHEEWRGYKAKIDERKKEQEARDLAAMFRAMFQK